MFKLKSPINNIGTELPPGEGDSAISERISAIFRAGQGEAGDTELYNQPG